MFNMFNVEKQSDVCASMEKENSMLYTLTVFEKKSKKSEMEMKVKLTRHFSYDRVSFSKRTVPLLSIYLHEINGGAIHITHDISSLKVFVNNT